jgi:Domain of Unknown Function (DUF1080)
VNRKIVPVLLVGLLPCPAFGAEPVPLFDGKDLTHWYTWIRDVGKDKDPNGNFTVKDAMLRIAGSDYGGLVTKDEYANYKIEMVWAWGGKVYPPRDKTARDSGLLVHSTGPDGAVSKSWMQSYQCNMLEGATGDITVTGPDKKYTFKAEAEDRPWAKKTLPFWKAGAPVREFGPSNRLVWFNRDPKWENVVGFRGRNDVEKPLGEWNTLVVTMKADMMTIELNGVTVNKATSMGVTKGRIQIQSEGSEVLIKRIVLTPIE